MGLTKEQKAQRTVQNASVLLLWYTAWLVAAKKAPKESDDLNAIVNQFMEEDEEMIRRFFHLPQKED